ncbi:CGNR zinc finger domain-containing protein [Actinomadura atramentaria]|uniref:CGNR zinc finger domain-containing protein n=1 Tax=Actinomadura atramentaria TaxID=1990 RepID=UPI00036D15E1|nr:CGNR zinc finger domain-containing protein [Actinomadura atramentaria]
MHFNAYGGTGARVAADLLNAPDDDPSTLSEILRVHGIARPELTAAHARRLAAWIERVRPVFGEPDVERQMAVLNALLEETATGVRISTHDGSEPHLHYVNQDLETAERVKAAIAGGLAVAVVAAGGVRLGRCLRDGCATVFIDTSRNGRRKFCSQRCANRVNVSAHRARRAARA